MSWLSAMLKKAGIITPYSEDEVMNAESENELFDQKRAGQEAAAELNTLREKSARLRGVMRDARLQVQSYAQFEQRIRDIAKLRRPH